MVASLTFQALKDTVLFQHLKLGSLTLRHRIALAPTTRMRGEPESRGVNVPGPRMATYYGARASLGGLQITEATDICLNASCFPFVPGVFTDSQLKGWKTVTDAVHAKGGFIFVQLWHTGRASSTGMRGGEQPVSSGTAPMSGKYIDGTECADDPPRALTVTEIKGLVNEWAAAAKRAVEEAGFNGVEIHGANGYLLDQFLNDNINQRTDEYGGSVEKRSRFLLEVLSAVSDAIGAERVGVRLSPFSNYQDTFDSDPVAHWSYVSQRMADLPESRRPAYVHMVEDETDPTTRSLTPFRKILEPAGIPFIACGNLKRENLVQKLQSGGADLVAFSRQFIANPDLPDRLANGWPLNPYDRSTFYVTQPPERGYNDYPVFMPVQL